VDPVPNPLLLRKSGRVGNRTRTSGSVARNSDHLTTEAAIISASLHAKLGTEVHIAEEQFLLEEQNLNIE
jgi:hypothetical protein